MPISMYRTLALGFGTITEALSDPLVSLGEQAGGNMALLSPHILVPDNPRITLYTDYLSSPTS